MHRCSKAVARQRPESYICRVTHLLLGPDGGGIGVLVEMRRQQVVRQGRNLLDPRNGNVVDLAVFTLLEELEVDLARAQDMTLDLVGRDEVLGVGFGQVSLEGRLADKLVEARLDERMTEKRFREEDDQLWLSAMLGAQAVGEEGDARVYGTLASSVVGERGSSWRGCCIVSKDPSR